MEIAREVISALVSYITVDQFVLWKHSNAMECTMTMSMFVILMVIVLLQIHVRVNMVFMELFVKMNIQSVMDCIPSIPVFVQVMEHVPMVSVHAAVDTLDQDVKTVIMVVAQVLPVYPPLHVQTSGNEHAPWPLHTGIRAKSSKMFGTQLPP